MTKLLITGLALGALVNNAAAAGDFVLVEKGAPRCTVVVPNAPGPAWFAAGELRYHVRLITGAELPIVKEKDAVMVWGRTTQMEETRRFLPHFGAPGRLSTHFRVGFSPLTRLSLFAG